MSQTTLSRVVGTLISPSNNGTLPVSLLPAAVELALASEDTRLACDLLWESSLTNKDGERLIGLLTKTHGSAATDTMNTLPKVSDSWGATSNYRVLLSCCVFALRTGTRAVNPSMAKIASMGLGKTSVSQNSDMSLEVRLQAVDQDTSESVCEGLAEHLRGLPREHRRKFHASAWRAVTLSSHPLAWSRAYWRLGDLHEVVNQNTWMSGSLGDDLIKRLLAPVVRDTSDKWVDDLLEAGDFDEEITEEDTWSYLNRETVILDYLLDLTAALGFANPGGAMELMNAWWVRTGGNATADLTHLLEDHLQVPYCRTWQDVPLSSLEDVDNLVAAWLLVKVDEELLQGNSNAWRLAAALPDDITLGQLAAAGEATTGKKK